MHGPLVFWQQSTKSWNIDKCILRRRKFAETSPSGSLRRSEATMSATEGHCSFVVQATESLAVLSGLLLFQRVVVTDASFAVICLDGMTIYPYQPGGLYRAAISNPNTVDH